MSKVREFQAKIYEKINPAVGFSVRRYVFAIGVFVAIFAFGLISILNLGVDLFPSINFPFVVVSTTYPGASPSVIDQQVTQVIENAVSTLSGITDLNSTSSNGVSLVFMSFDASTDQNSDANQVASLVSAAVRQLPQGIGAPLIQTFNPSSIPIMQFGLSGSGASLGEVDTYITNDLTPLLERVSGVANIKVDGGPVRQFQVLLNPNRLQSYGLSPQAVVGAIAASAVDQPIGTIDRHDNALTFATENVPADASMVAEVLVDPIRGIRVGDVAAVRDLPVSTSYARVNGKPVVLVSIQQTSTSNAVAVVKEVRALLARTKMPAGYQVDFSNDTTASIRASLESTYREIAITAVVVALIVLLFLGKLNTAFSVILAVPIALSAAPILFNLAGFTLNLVSMLAMIVAIGVVVDDSIVVAENVERYRAMGFGQREAVLKGASEIFSAVVAATLSLLVLIPVSFIGGIIGDFLRQFALGLAAAVAFSLLEAVLFLTVRLAVYAGDSADPRLGRPPPKLREDRRIDGLGPQGLEEGRRDRRRDRRAHSPRRDEELPLHAGPAALSFRARPPALPGPHPPRVLPGAHDDSSRVDRGRTRMGQGRLRQVPRRPHRAGASSSSSPPRSSSSSSSSSSCRG